MPECSLCKGPLQPEGGAILFTGYGGVPFEVCVACGEKINLLFESQDETQIRSALDFIAQCVDKAGNKAEYDEFLDFIKRNRPPKVDKQYISKRLKIILLCAVITVALIVSSLYVGFTISDELALQRFSQQLFSYSLPEKTARVNEVCNQDFNSIESSKLSFWAFMLIKSDLPLEAVQTYYKNACFEPAISGKEDSLNVTVSAVTGPKDLNIYKTLGDKWQHRYFEDSSAYASYYWVFLEDSGYSADFDLRYAVH